MIKFKSIVKCAISGLAKKYYQSWRIFLFKALSDVEVVEGEVNLTHPVLFKGLGKITIGIGVQFGYFPSPRYYDSASYLEVRNEAARIIIGNNVFINNACRFICDKSTIKIGDDTLIGINVEILDSDFHGILPENRRNGNYDVKEVEIGKNVFIGNNVIILKGVSIGDNSIIANGCVVTKSIPPNVIAGGNPAKIIKHFYDQ